MGNVKCACRHDRYMEAVGSIQHSGAINTRYLCWQLGGGEIWITVSRVMGDDPFFWFGNLKEKSGKEDQTEPNL